MTSALGQKINSEVTPSDVEGSPRIDYNLAMVVEESDRVSLKVVECDAALPKTNEWSITLYNPTCDLAGSTESSATATALMI